jgi:hypothetical protein
MIHHEGTKGTRVHEAATAHPECVVGRFVSFVLFVPSW